PGGIEHPVGVPRLTQPGHTDRVFYPAGGIGPAGFALPYFLAHDCHAAPPPLTWVRDLQPPGERAQPFPPARPQGPDRRSTTGGRAKPPLPLSRAPVSSVEFPNKGTIHGPRILENPGGRGRPRP